jgi:ribosomal protein S18 acetylase RimI-like enzyme
MLGGVISECRIRLATAADAHAIARLSRDAIEQGLGWSWTPRRVMANVADASTNAVVARDPAHGRLLGFALMSYAEEDAHLLLLAVHAAERRRGVGSALLHWLEATVQVAGLAAIHLEVRQRSQGARAFYRRHGFDEVGRVVGYYQGVEDAIRMVKRRTMARPLRLAR